MPVTMHEEIERWTEPGFKFNINRREDHLKFLIKHERMKGEFLGTCLDYIRYGSMNGVAFPMTVYQLIGFIQHWMKLNKDNLIWDEQPMPANFDLPRINYNRCQRNNTHTKTILDAGGKLRCAHIEKHTVREGFNYSYNYFDEFSNLNETVICDDKPREPDGDDDGSVDEDEFDRYEEKQERYEQAREVEVISPCYAIINEGRRILELETVLDRINCAPKTKTVYCGRTEGLSPCRRLDELDEYDRKLAEFDWCPGHEEENPWVIVPFGGHTLADFVHKWYEQPSQPVFRPVGKPDSYKEFPNFQLISSED